jgi:hypothetical protein
MKNLRLKCKINIKKQYKFLTLLYYQPFLRGYLNKLNRTA